MDQFGTMVIVGSYQLYAALQTYRRQLIAGLLILVYTAVMLCFLHDYFIMDVTVWAAIFSALYIVKPNSDKAGNMKYCWLSAVFILITYITGVKTFYFLSIGFAILFVIESIVGSIGHLPFFLLGLISPTFKYFDNMLGFPIRLKLSEWVGSILKHLGYKVKVVGNAFQMNGAEFSVDPACVGLKMMAVSILIGLIMMACFQHLEKRKFSFLSALAILIIIAVLNVVSNLLRILMLSIFCILPANPGHDIVGLICLLLYVVVPSYFLIKYAANNWLVKENDECGVIYSRKRAIPLHLILLGTIIFVGFAQMNEKVALRMDIHSLSLDGYSKELVNDGVVKLEKKGILLYIKPLQRFYGAEHNPMICWVGSGYEFSHINKQKIGNKEVFTGPLKKGTDLIYAAWWFDNGKYQTINQADWRWRAFKGESFYLVNVNACSEAQLWEEVKTLVKQ